MQKVAASAKRNTRGQTIIGYQMTTILGSSQFLVKLWQDRRITIRIIERVENSFNSFYQNRTIFNSKLGILVQQLLTLP